MFTFSIQCLLLILFCSLLSHHNLALSMTSSQSSSHHHRPTPTTIKTTTATTTSSRRNQRVELIVHDDMSTLRQRIQFFTFHGIYAFTIVNKNPKDTLQEWIDSIRKFELESCEEEYPTSSTTTTTTTTTTRRKVDICVQYSLKYNKIPRKGINEHAEHLVEFIQSQESGGDKKQQQQQSPKQQGRRGQEGANEILIVSGVMGNTRDKFKPRWNTVTALKYVSPLYNNGSTTTTTLTTPAIAVVYNPYFPNFKDQMEENDRLDQKMTIMYNGDDNDNDNNNNNSNHSLPIVSKIYLQFGTDLIRLKETLQRLQITYPHVTIAGSLFLPPTTQQQRITQQPQEQQFRHRRTDIFFGNEFLSSSTSTRLQIILEIMKLYQQYNVECLWEASSIRTPMDMTIVNELWNDVDEWKNNQNKIIDPPPPNNDQEGLSSENFGQDKMVPSIETKSLSGLQGTEMNTSWTSSSSSSSPCRDDDTKLQQDIPSNNPKNQRTSTPGIVLFGSHDVRLSDNRALELAAQCHQYVLPVFLWTPQQQGKWGVTGALEVVLKDALKSLEEALKGYGLTLYCFNCEEETETETDGGTTTSTTTTTTSTGDGTKELIEFATSVGATGVYWNREHTPESHRIEQQRRKALEQIKGVQVHELQSSLLYNPETVELSTGFNGGHWGTLMPFIKCCKQQQGDPPRPTPQYETFRLLEEVNDLPSSALLPIHQETRTFLSVDRLPFAVIHGKDKWDEPIRNRFSMSETAARNVLNTFLKNGLQRYESERSRADKEFATSELSPHLRIGTLSPNELYWRIEDSGLPYEELKTFARRLLWRELAYYQLYCFPNMRNIPIRKHYETMEWITGEEEIRRFNAWKTGTTGFPIVDAGMRELYATGWMTQSVRMVVASFLVEYLRVNWVKGCEWFHYTLVDADSAINAMMWQNAGKSGIDQWNFILSPITASQDPTGEYTCQWVPELAQLPTAGLIHRPWEAPQDVLEQAGIVLGTTYPHRIIVKLKEERAISVQKTLEMRRDAQHANTDRGYDLIELPGNSTGQKTIVFTKKEYRIDKEGNVLNGSDTIRPRKPAKRRRRRSSKGRY